MKCEEIKLPESPYKCDYLPPVVKHILVRRNKKGQVQVKINGKGKWIGARLEGDIITFSA